MSCIMFTSVDCRRSELLNQLGSTASDLQVCTYCFVSSHSFSRMLQDAFQYRLG